MLANAHGFWPHEELHVCNINTFIFVKKNIQINKCFCVLGDRYA